MPSDPNHGVKPLDMDAVGEAVDLLRAAGYAVEGVNEVSRDERQGVKFDLTCSIPTRVKGLSEHEAEESPDEGELIPDGGEVKTAEPDETLRLTDEGIEMPDMLRGYVGSFTLRTADITGDFETTESGLPDTDYFDGVIAVYPEDDGDYNPHLEEGLMSLETDEHPERVFRVVDETTADMEGENGA